MRDRQAFNIGRTLLALAIPSVLVGGFGHRTDLTAFATVLLVVALVAFGRSDR